MSDPVQSVLRLKAMMDEDVLFSEGEMIAMRDAVTALRALEYVFGRMGMEQWEDIVSQGMTPPWPLQVHADAAGMVHVSEITRLKQTIDQYDRGLISTPYTRALVDQHSNRATQYYIEVIRLNRVVQRLSAKVKRMREALRAKA